MFGDLKVNVETRPKKEEGGGGCSGMRGGERRWQRGDLSRGSKKNLHSHQSRLVDPSGPFYYFGGRRPTSIITVGF